MDYFTNREAIDIWKAKWLGVGPQKLVETYKKSPFRIYEVWSEDKNIGSREEAKSEFIHEHPELIEVTDFSPHKKRRKVVHLPTKDKGQLDLFL